MAEPSGPATTCGVGWAAPIPARAKASTRKDFSSWSEPARSVAARARASIVFETSPAVRATGPRAVITAIAATAPRSWAGAARCATAVAQQPRSW